MDLHRYLYSCLNKKLNTENSNLNRIKIYPHQGKGKVVYSPSANGICDPTWVILECDKDIIKYYKWFLEKKGIKLESLLWGSHISVIRGETWDFIDEEHMKLWKYNDNSIINFEYGDLVTNGTHWWLEVQSQELEDMRKKLGLKPHPDFGFHITIGKIKQFK